MAMECAEIREGLSARLDGEDPGPGTTAQEIDRHLTTCPGLRGLGRRARRPAPDGPRPGGGTRPRPQRRHRRRLRAPGRLPAAPAARWPSGSARVRWALFAVALTQLVLAGARPAPRRGRRGHRPRRPRARLLRRRPRRGPPRRGLAARPGLGPPPRRCRAGPRDGRDRGARHGRRAGIDVSAKPTTSSTSRGSRLLWLVARDWLPPPDASAAGRRRPLPRTPARPVGASSAPWRCSSWLAVRCSRQRPPAPTPPSSRSIRRTGRGSTASPEQVQLTFSEHVSASLGGVRVLDSDGEPGRPGRGPR